jgi:GAF domain-containing protein
MRRNPQRLAALKQAMILDTGPERIFDDATRLLSGSLGVPISIVNVLDEDRDWFKSCVGLPLTESPAATSFCEVFFDSPDDLIVVEDTTRDDRFATHPLVVGEPFVRFYAAARLAVHGHTIGTLCAYDIKPNRLSTEKVAVLQTMASALIERLERR